MIKLFIDSIFFLIALPTFLIVWLIVFWDGICWSIFCYKNREKFIDPYGSWLVTARMPTGADSEEDKERLMEYLLPYRYLFIKEYYLYYQKRKKKGRIIKKIAIFIFFSFLLFILSTMRSK